MATGKYDFVYKIGFTADTTDLQNKIQVFNDNLSKKPLNLSADLGKGIDAGNTQAFIDNITKAGGKITDLKVITEDFTTASGQKWTSVTKVIAEYINAQGKAATATGNVSSKVVALKEGENILKSLGAKADEWAVKSEHMNKADKQAIQGVIQKIQEETIAYEKSASRKNASTKTIETHNAKLRDLEKQLDRVTDGTKRSAVGLQGWADNIKRALVQTVSYALSLGLVRNAQRILQEAIKYTIELNKEMVKIQVLQAEGAQTPEEIRELASAYNVLAQQLGVTTIEVAQGSVEWLRQGKTIQETTELLKASTALSKLGNLAAAEATEYLTSTLNSYKLEAKDAISVVDKLVAVDNKSATSSKEMAVALRYVAATAAESSVTLEQLISYIATMSSVTRINAESIGQSLKTMFARMNDIKAGAIDEDGLGINNVEDALSRANVALRDAQGNWRNLGDVLEELAPKWDTLDSTTQRYLSKTIAGVRQQNLFVVLMQNMNDALQYQTIQANSAGTAMDRYKIYLQSVEAAQNRVKASLQGLYQDAINSGLIVGIYDTINGILKLIESLGGLKNIITVVIGVMVAFNSKLIINKALTFLFGKDIATMVLLMGSYKAAILASIGADATKSLSMGILKFAIDRVKNALIQANAALGPIGWAILGITAAVAVFNGVSQASEKAEQKRIQQVEEYKQKLIETSEILKKLAGDKNELTGLWNRFEELKNIVSLNNDQLKEFYDIQTKIIGLTPSLVYTLDEEGRAILTNSTSLKELLALKDEELEIAKKEAAKAAKDYVELESSNYEDKIKKVRKLSKAVYELSTAEGIEGELKWFMTEKEAKKQYAEAIKALTSSKIELKKNLILMGSEARQAFIDGLIANGQTDLVDIIYDLLGMGKGQGTSWSQTAGFEGISGLTIPIDIDDADFYSKASGVQSSFKKIQDAKDKLANGKPLEASEIAELEKTGIDVVNLDNGLQELTEGSIQKYIDSTISMYETTYNLTEEQARFLYSILELKPAVEDLGKTFDTNQGLLESVQKELSETGQISYETAMKLIEAGYAEAVMVNEETGAITVNTAVLRANALAEAQAAMNAAYEAASKAGAITSLDAHTQALWREWQVRKSIYDLLNKGGGFTIPSVSGGGGGSGGEDPEKKRLEDQIDAIEKLKKALKDRLDEYKKWIDAQKESLKLAKEEADFNKEQAKSAKDLAKLRTRIAILALDDSEKARADRLKLEEEAAELEEEIAENSEERKYDLQMEAYDRMEQQFEDMINAQIEGYDKMIEAIREMIDALEEAGGSGGVAFNNVADAATNVQEPLEGIDQFLMDKLPGAFESLSEQAKAQLREMAQGVIDGTVPMQNLVDLYNQLVSKELNITIRETYVTGGAGGGWRPPAQRHQGGLIESHHDGNFAGNLNSNEVFAKLLKGEYVATEGQMNNFMKNILPKISSMPFKEYITNEKSTIMGDTTIDLDINVAGNMDKSVVPDIKREVFDALNSALKQKGKKTNTFNYSI